MMLSLNYKIDSFILPLDAYYKSKDKQDGELLKIVESIEVLVRQFISSTHDVKAFSNQNLDTIWDFRISAIKWLIVHNIRIDDYEELIANDLEPLKNDPVFSILYENVLFAIRTNVRAISSLMDKNAPFSSKNVIDFSNISDIPKISFTSFLNIISLTGIDSVLPIYIDWLISSLYIEFGIISLFVIHNKKLAINRDKVNELATFIADSAQEFGAITKELRPQIKKKNKPYPKNIPQEFLLEQTFLAEQDIESF
jgi:hypothetical protein